MSPRPAAPDHGFPLSDKIGCGLSGRHTVEIPDVLHPITQDNAHPTCPARTAPPEAVRPGRWLRQSAGGIEPADPKHIPVGRWRPADLRDLRRHRHGTERPALAGRRRDWVTGHRARRRGMALAGRRRDRRGTAPKRQARARGNRRGIAPGHGLWACQLRHGTGRLASARARHRVGTSRPARHLAGGVGRVGSRRVRSVVSKANAGRCAARRWYRASGRRVESSGVGLRRSLVTGGLAAPAWGVARGPGGFRRARGGRGRGGGRRGGRGR